MGGEPVAPNGDPRSDPPPEAGPAFRSGFVSLAGRPNAGKSTLLNRIVGRDLAITSAHPQTTRRNIRGVVTDADAQVIIVDTPGLHRPRTLLGERLNELTKSTWADVDLVCWCIVAVEKAGPGDRHLAADLAAAGTPVVVVVTKTDIATPGQIASRLADAASLSAAAGLDPVEFVPVSAVTDSNVDVLLSVIRARLPLGPMLFPASDVTDQCDEDLIADLIRQAALAGVRDELPHSLAVTIDEMGPREGRTEERPLIDIHATIHVERDSQKPIVIGKGGVRLRELGTAARRDIERLLGARVHLNLHVRVAKDWQRDPKQLGRLGL